MSALRLVSTKGRGKDLTLTKPIRRFLISEEYERKHGGRYSLMWFLAVNGVAIVWQKGKILDKEQLLETLKLIIRSIEIDLEGRERQRKGQLVGDLRYFRVDARKFLEKGLTPIPEDVKRKKNEEGKDV